MLCCLCRASQRIVCSRGVYLGDQFPFPNVVFGIVVSYCLFLKMCLLTWAILFQIIVDTPLSLIIVRITHLFYVSMVPLEDAHAHAYTDPLSSPLWVYHHLALPAINYFIAPEIAP